MVDHLPIDDKITEILAALKNADSLVLAASPGAGKTTRLPPALLSQTSKQVWVLEPRRMSTLAAAHRIAEEQGWRVGDEVGYQVRFENKTSKNTRLVFLTEALLARKLLQDPDLANVGIVVLDEFHERSVHVDLALGLLKELQLLSRPDLKLVVMSATLDVHAVSQFLGQAPIIEVPGRLFDLEIVKSQQSQLLRTDYQFIDKVFEAIKKSFHSSRDILVFLPGLSEISRLQKRLEEWSKENNSLVCALHGSLGVDEQLRVLKPQKNKKIILSTNIAESSVTIDGVDTVIDSGLVRILRKHPKTDFEQLVTSRISKASAQQRAGRAARQWPGRSLQLWNTQDELSMPEFEIAEIYRIDLTESILYLKKWGAVDINAFSWFEKPNSESLLKSESWLEKIGALEKGRITPLGMELAALPVQPRVGQILKVAEKLKASSLGCDIAALLQERDMKSLGQHPEESDLLERLDHLESFRAQPFKNRELEQVRRSSEQLQGLVSESYQEPSFELVAEILLLASSDRLCRRRAPGRRQALMVGGRGVELAETSAVHQSEFFIAIDLQEGPSSGPHSGRNSNDTFVRRATGVPKSLIEKHFARFFKKMSRLSFDEASKNFYIDEFSSLWDLPIEEPRRRLAKPEELESQLPQALLESFEQVLLTNEDFGQWWRRFQYYEKKLDTNIWLPEKRLQAFAQACFGENKWSQVVAKDLIYFFENLLDQQVLSDFNRKCPAKFLVPTQNKIRLHYHLDKNPHLEVRLQELFGMKETPLVWDEKVPVTLHLLGPNYRPVQMTSDLASFWKNTYPQVRSELRTKYPKHSWPDDPLTAPAVARGRPKK
jgi:ATP-dependent helicase HrpB